jgi:hypothetical protein
MAPDYRPVRLYQGRDLAAVVAAVLDAFPGARVQPAEARPMAESQGVVIKGITTVGSPHPLVLILEVSVVQTADAVRVSVRAEPPEEGPPRPGASDRPREDASRRGCSSCPRSDPLTPVAAWPRDNLLMLSESRKLVRAYLAALDARLH